ncbi:ATP-binding cassette domain-containing protein [Rhodoferax sp.]|uniref:ATP-binding cassette domain-containing protein n=1 Tax=Rhodoferax sp. TaxID=50421 RepID=UPI002ACDC5B9|nr:ATP-binding cassette domain-containing protein [Rhodoferax sp.]MDZ7921687.1 ATP-binding cassette domain-containing protein [Rhodoferax sp.]
MRVRCCGTCALDIALGQVIGIAGRSGSGKSTLTKLVQRLYVPEQGRVLIDNVDIAQVDAAQIRRQIGVVLQDNWLFNRSIRENISISQPAAPWTRSSMRPSWRVPMDYQ